MQEKPFTCDVSLAKDLDDEQLKAVCAPLTNTCVFAIAGSGKTRVLTYRVANLINNGIPENSMLLLTFTNKAADEMTSRIKTLLKKKKLTLTAGTFHSIASLFLRKYSEELNISKRFDILDAKAQKTLIRKCRDQYVYNYKVKDSEFPSHNVLTEIYSGAINHNLSFVEYMKKYYPYIRGITIDGILLIFEDYVERKEQTNCLDFDDLLLSFYDLLKINKVREEITEHFRYIFVDEYQDINWLQYEILELLNASNSMFVIGDSNQCIYQFRGSNDKYIDIFEASHQNTQKYHLTYNYRSTPEILALAESSINNNPVSSHVYLHTKNSSSQRPLIFGTQTKEEQIRVIAEDIMDNHSSELNEVAVLVRKGAEIQEIREMLRTEGISAQIKGGNDLLNTRYFNDIYNILSFVENPYNEVAFEYTFSLMGLNVSTIKKIYSYLKKEKFRMDDFSLTLDKDSKNITKFLMNIQSKPYSNVSEKLEDIYNSFYRRYINMRYANASEIEEVVEFFINSSARFSTISQFLDFYILERNKEKEDKTKDTVTIITMHKAKGLEWKYVYIVNLNKTEFPRSKDKDIDDNTEQVQNERKLFYVAITRAKEELTIGYSMKNTDKKDIGPSAFLEELDPKIFDAEFYS